jgi:DNA-binding transcriptional LysR family regulator
VISIIHISARSATPFLRHPDWNQYTKLADWLSAQTYRDFEVICVTPFPQETTILASLEQTTIAVPPRDTPWLRAKTRCSASARNTGLIHARGEYVVALDDCCEIAPDHLERVASWLERGIGVATLSANADGKLIDGRLPIIGDYAAVLTREAVALGLVAFPTELGLDLNGWDEHFDGGYGLEDADMGVRLARAGLGMALDKHIYAKLHDTTCLSPLAVAPDDLADDPVRSNVRCCDSAFVLARESGIRRVNEVPYTREQIERRLNCFLLHGDKCGYWLDKQPCAYPHLARGGHPVARRIMLDEGYPETVDLRAERKKVGL